MAANGSYNPATKVLTVTGDGLPNPVGYGTFPNDNNPNTVTAYNFSHQFTYRGGENTSNSGSFGLGIVGIAANGVALFNPSAGAGGNPPQGFSYVAAGTNAAISFGEDNCGGHPEQTGQYHYHDSHFLECWNANSIITTYNDYYGTSQYNGDSLRHPDGHSKILGFAFDGYPVYGPWAYSDPNDNTSSVVKMQSGYQVRTNETPGRPAYGPQYPAGVFMQDYEYIGGEGKLDTHNGRYSVTPEFPSGTWAYFLTVDEENNPVFPFIFGTTSKEALSIPENDGFNPIVEGGGGGEGGGEGGAEPPTLVITNQPTNATVSSGNVQTFTVLAEIQPENGPIGYQWQVSTDGGFAWSNIQGATGNVLTITALAFMTGYRYRAILTGPIGAPAAQNSPLSSNLAILTVTGSGTQIDYSAILKWDNDIGKYSMTQVEFDRDNNNPDFTRSNLFFDNTSENFDMT